MRRKTVTLTVSRCNSILGELSDFFFPLELGLFSVSKKKKSKSFANHLDSTGKKIQLKDKEIISYGFLFLTVKMIKNIIILLKVLFVMVPINRTRWSSSYFFRRKQSQKISLDDLEQAMRNQILPCSGIYHKLVWYH